MVKVRKKKSSEDVCEISLLIEKDEELVDWDDDNLVKSIVEEVDIAEASAHEIAANVKEKIKLVAENMGWKSVDSAFIREFVSNELLEKGKKYKNKAGLYNAIGLSAKEIEIINENTGDNENSNLLGSPESVSFSVSEVVLKKYALQSIFSNKISSAHVNGKLYLHDLSSVANKAYCGSVSPAYIIKNGLNLPTINSVSKSATHAEVLVSHILSFCTIMSSVLAGACGLDAINVFMSPFLVGKTEEEIEQIAQMLIFGFSQLASTKAQTIFSDLNVYTEVPDYLAETKALGPKGKYYKFITSFNGDIIKEVPKEEASTYKEFNKYAQMFLVKCMDVLAKGDSNGTPFIFPKFLCHINDDSFKEENQWVLDKIIEASSINGSPYFVLDRGASVKVGQCCRLSKSLDSEDLIAVKNHPEDVRFCALQNITLNLPDYACEIKYKNENAPIDDMYKLLIDKIREYMNLAVVAHKEKYRQFKKIYNIHNGVLKFAKEGMDGKPFINLKKLTYIIGLIGLNEVVQVFTGKALHESEDSYNLALKIVAEMSIYADKLSKENDMNITLEESPAESATKSLCMASIRNTEYGHIARAVAKGSVKDGNAYWTNSVHYDNVQEVGYIERIVGQSKFHPMIKSGAIVLVHVGENLPSKESIKNLLTKVYKETMCMQFVICPTFTLCNNCKKTTLANSKKCPQCGSDDIDHLERIVGYFSKVSNWSKNKKEERKHRITTFSKNF